MTENTKQFLIKVLLVGAVVLVLYFVASPYQNCLRTEGFPESVQGEDQNDTLIRQIAMYDARVAEIRTEGREPRYNELDEWFEQNSGGISYDHARNRLMKSGCRMETSW